MNILKSVILSATKWSRKISIYALYSILLVLAACTDYEAQIDDEYEEWIAEHEENESIVQLLCQDCLLLLHEKIIIQRLIVILQHH
jgi:hypothetical protein